MSERIKTINNNVLELIKVANNIREEGNSDEKIFAREELQEIVVSEKNIGLDINKLSDENRVSIKILQAWELHQIEVGLKLADYFYKNLMYEKIKKFLTTELEKNPNKIYRYVNDKTQANLSNIDAYLKLIID